MRGKPRPTDLMSDYTKTHTVKHTNTHAHILSLCKNRYLNTANSYIYIEINLLLKVDVFFLFKSVFPIHINQVLV